MREEVDSRLESFQMFEKKLNRVARDVSSTSRPIGNSNHDQERLFFLHNFERFSKAIPILFIKNAHKIKK